MRIHLIYKTREEPWGGGNQFLKALKNEFLEKGVYEEDPTEASHFLFNSHHYLRDVLKLKLKYPKKIFMHRVDGPIFLIRKGDLKLDRLIFSFSQAIADITIFQSNWSYNHCRRFGFNNERSIIIHNAADPNIFNRKDKRAFRKNGKIKLIATSWSSNWGKGFKFYNYLDENLDYNKFEFIFIGNSPIKFNNIKIIKPLPSKGLANVLKKADIFITASESDPCSNSLIEALNCGLPALVLNDGGHPELIGKGGETFSTSNEFYSKLEKIIMNYSQYQMNITNYNISDIADQYVTAFNTLVENENYVPKKLGLIKYYIRVLELLLKRY